MLTLSFTWRKTLMSKLIKGLLETGKWGAYLLALTLEKPTGIMTVLQWFLSQRVMSCVERMLPSQVPHQVWCSAQVLHTSMLVSCLRCWTFSLKSPLIGESWIEFTVVTRVSHAWLWCTRLPALLPFPRLVQRCLCLLRSFKRTCWWFWASHLC